MSGKDVDDINRILRYLIKYQIEKIPLKKYFEW